MKTTLGERIAMLRKQQGMTQEELGTAVGLSAQAVSKWERDESCPDIMLLPKLARLLDVTVDALLTGEQEAETRLLPAQQRKTLEQMLLKIRVDSKDGTKVKVNVPLVLLRAMMEHEGAAEGLNVNGKGFTEHIDMEMIMKLIDSGVVGKLVEVDDGGDHVEVYVE